MITIVKAIQTCMACPSQWDAWDAEGNYYYLRYRSGCGSVTQYQTADWVGAPWVDDGTKYGRNSQFIAHIASFEHGHYLDGSMTLEEFAGHADLRLAPDIKRTAFWRHTMNQLGGNLAGDPAALARADQLLGGVDLDQE